MLVFYAIPEPFCSKPDEEEVRQGVYDFGRVYGGIIILCPNVREVCYVIQFSVSDIPSHQFNVEVTGPQYPASG